MRKCLGILFFLCYSLLGVAQPAKKPATTKAAAQSQMDKMMEDAMKAQGMTAEQRAEVRKAMEQANQVKKAGITSMNMGTDIPVLPARQTKLLQQIPAVQTAAQLNTYSKELMATCKKNIPAAIVSKVDQLLTSLSGNELELAQLPITLFLAKNPKAAAYAAVKVLQLKPADMLVLNNSAFVLQQCGYPDKALPVFRFLQQQHNTAEFNNNLGQCYLSLGDPEKAKECFDKGLLEDPQSSEMHIGMAILLLAEGNQEAAAFHIAESLKSGYSIMAESLASKNKVNVKFSDIRSKAPEYFNPNKFKPVPYAGNMEEMPAVESERQAQEERVREMQQKTEETSAAYNATLNENNLAQGLQQVMGYMGTTPFSRKAKYMMDLINKEQYEEALSNFGMREYQAKNDELKKAFDKEFESIQHRDFGNENLMAKTCEAHVKNLDNYLRETKDNFDNYSRHALPKIYEFTNQSLYWQSFLINGQAYKAYFNAEVQRFYGSILTLSNLQILYPMPAWIYANCKNYKMELEKMKLAAIQEQLDCPINIKVPAGKMATLKLNCKSFEIEGGELLKLGYEENLKNGDFTLAFGLGIDASTGLLNVGAKGMMYFKFSKDFTPMDMGMKGEAGVEAEMFIFSVDEKLTAAMGISSVNVDAVHMGKEINLFNVDATKDSRDADASIKPIK